MKIHLTRPSQAYFFEKKTFQGSMCSKFQVSIVFVWSEGEEQTNQPTRTYVSKYRNYYHLRVSRGCKNYEKQVNRRDMRKTTCSGMFQGLGECVYQILGLAFFVWSEGQAQTGRRANLCILYRLNVSRLFEHSDLQFLLKFLGTGQLSNLSAKLRIYKRGNCIKCNFLLFR